MFTVIVSIHVLPECVDDFIAITRYNAENSRLEAGVVRFDFRRLTTPTASVWWKFIEVKMTRQRINKALITKNGGKRSRR